MPDYQPGRIGICTSELARYSIFAKDLRRLKVPPQTAFDWQESSGFAFDRNKVIHHALEANDAWVMFLDDDQTFESDTLLRLLDRQVPIIQALTVRRGPYLPLAWHYRDGEFIEARWDEIPASGISEWDAVAPGCTVYRTEVFRAMSAPWFELGQIEPDKMSDDLYFCVKAKQAGFSCFIDSDVTSGHMTAMQLRPRYIGGQWRSIAQQGEFSWRPL